jgi:glycerol uptake facilitator protein
MKLTAEKSLSGKIVAEIIGTFLLILMGDGVVANVGLGPRLAAPAYNWVAITFGWGLAVAVAVYAVAGVSGAHINPAVTIGLAVKGDFPWRDVVPFIIAQMIGAFLGALGVYIAYYDGLVSAGMPNVWCTGPGSIFGQAFWGGTGGTAVGSYSLANCFATEIIGTMVLLIGVCAIVDSKNVGAGANTGPFMIGMLVVGIGLTLGGPSGYAINPARDLGPRIFGTLVGTTGLFATGGGWYWIGPPVIGAIIGGILGCLIYKYLVSRFLPKK